MSRIDRFEQEKHQKIEELVQQVLQLTNDTQKQAAIHQIAVMVLRSRPLCRRFNGTPLIGVYQAIYLRAKEQLIKNIAAQVKLIQQESSPAPNQIGRAHV